MMLVAAPTKHQVKVPAFFGNRNNALSRSLAP